MADEIILGRPAEDEARYQCERACLNQADRDLACLLSAIERDRSATPRNTPIPIYEHMAFALKDKALRVALIDALTRTPK